MTDSIKFASGESSPVKVRFSLTNSMRTPRLVSFCTMSRPRSAAVCLSSASDGRSRYWSDRKRLSSSSRTTSSGGAIQFRARLVQIRQPFEPLDGCQLELSFGSAPTGHSWYLVGNCVVVLRDFALHPIGDLLRLALRMKFVLARHLVKEVLRFVKRRL